MKTLKGTTSYQCYGPAIDDCYEDSEGRLFAGRGNRMKELEYLNLKQITEKYPFTKAQLDYHVRKRQKNGLDKAVRKICRRLYIRTDLFEEWIESHAEKTI